MKITKYGVIMAAKNIGVWIATFTISGIKAAPEEFILAFIIYALISVPSDLYMLNHLETACKDAAAKEALMGKP